MISRLYVHSKHFFHKMIPFIQAILVLILVAVWVYCEYNNTFIIDEIHDGNALRPLKIEDKLIIRVQSPSDTAVLKKFVEHYSLCPCVLDILVVSAPGTSVSPDVTFQYQKTHATVTFMSEEADEMNYWIQTDSLMLLDPSIYVSCDDLKFTLSIWKSSQDSLVGYLPRLHSSSDGDKELISYLGWLHVWWHGQYSIMLPSAVIMKKSYWETYVGKSEEVAALHGIIKEHPECEDMALPLWAAFNRATPPIWVDVPMAVDHIALKKEKHKGGSDQSQVLSDGATWMEWNGLNSWFRGDPSRIGGGGDVRISKPLAAAMSRDACLNTVYSTLRRPEMRYSTHKAANAKTLLFW